MLYITVFICFLAMFTTTYAILITFYRDKIFIRNRIEQVRENNTVSTEKVLFSERALLALYKLLNQFFLKITPRHKLNIIKAKLEKAGLSKDVNVEKWFFIKNMLILIISTLCGLVSYAIEPNGFKAIVISVFFMTFVNVYFNFTISKKIEKRKRKILKDLPYTIDLITVSVEAGLSFDGAIARVIGNIKGELCEEFAQSLKEIRMGIERKVALRNMSKRCDIKELSILITSVIQADELGVSLGKALRIESANLREHRKQIAREKAMKAPIKMLFPLIFFIFPSIFVIILGPAIINIIKIFVKG